MTDHSQHHTEWEKAEIQTNPLNSEARQRFPPSLIQNSTGSLRAKSKKKQERASLYSFFKKKRSQTILFHRQQDFIEKTFDSTKSSSVRMQDIKLAVLRLEGTVQWQNESLAYMRSMNMKTAATVKEIKYSQLLEQISKNKFGKGNG